VGGRPDSVYYQAAARLSHYFSSHAELFCPLFLTRDTAPAHEIITKRMQAVHELWQSAHPHPPGVAAWVNTFVATHIPAFELTQRSSVTITDVYRQQKNPERVVTSQLLMPHDFGCENELYKVWDLNLPTGQHRINATVLKLFYKGAPHPTSIRYCGGQIKKCAQTQGKPEQIVRSMLIAHALQLYHYCDVVKPWSLFVRLINQSTPDLVDEYCANQTCKQLYMIITKWIVAVSLQNTPLAVTLKQMPGQSAHIDAVVSGQICLGARPIYTPQHMHSALVKTMRLRSKIPPDAIRQIGASAIVTIFRNIVRTPHMYGQHHITRAHLRMTGMDDAAITLISKLPAGPFIPSAKIVRALVSSLGPLNRARFYIALYSLQHRACLPRRHYLGDAVFAAMRARALATFGVDKVLSHMCLWCNDWRSHLRSSGDGTNGSKPQKQKHGVTLPIDGVSPPTCSCCNQSDGIASIDMVGCVIIVGSSTGKPRRIALCYECMAPSVNPHIIGSLPFCDEHFKGAMRQQHGTCVCGAINSGPSQLLVDSNGRSVVCRFCPAHIKERPDTTDVKVADICRHLNLR
jgi:hypothetical protein